MKRHAEAKVCAPPARTMRMRSRLAGKMPSRWRFGWMIAFLLCFFPPALWAQIRTIYVIPSTHWDRGFLTSPEEILPRLKPHIDEVIEDAAADPQFRWTIESIWQLNEWLKRTHDPKRIQELRDLLPKGTAGSVKATDTSLFSTDRPDVIVMAAEPSLAHAGAVVVRLQNLSGVKHNVRLQLPADGLEAAEVNLNETPLGSGRLPVSGRSVAVEISPHAAASILVSRPAK